MKIAPQAMLGLGINKNHIKFFVGKEFENESDLLNKYNDFLNQNKTTELNLGTWLYWFTYQYPRAMLPGMEREGKWVQVSNSEIKRWIESHSIIVNGKAIDLDTEIEETDFPIRELVFFPKSSKKRTYI